MTSACGVFPDPHDLVGARVTEALGGRAPIGVCLVGVAVTATPSGAGGRQRGFVIERR
jgi:hypothetical protein